MMIPRMLGVLSIFNPSIRRWIAAPSHLTGSKSDISKSSQNTKSPHYCLSTWNIDASSARPVARATAIINHLLAPSSPPSDIVFLQEVTLEVRNHLLQDSRIRSGFIVTDAEDIAAFEDVPFATMTLLSKALVSSPTCDKHATIGAATRFKMPGQYQRDALCTDVFLKPFARPSSEMDIQEYYRLRLLNIHLDSSSSTISFRKRQMRYVSKILHEKTTLESGQRSIGLAAGDFNTISQDDQGLIAKNGPVDAWLEFYGLGSQGSIWRTNKQKSQLLPGRLDRIAMTGGLHPLEIQVLNPGFIAVPGPGMEKDGEKDHTSQFDSMASHHLFTAASAVLNAAKVALGPSAANTRVSIVGALSVLKYAPYRQTKDVDIFLLGGNLKRQELKRELPRVDSNLTVNMEGIYGVTYRCPVTKKITPVDLVNRRLTKFEPHSKILANLERLELPWPTRDDVILMKAFSASERYIDAKRDRDIEDVIKILEMSPGPLLFSESIDAKEKLAFVRSLLPHLVGNGIWSEEEWVMRLGFNL
uniref:Endonuclease/exonuclease/phosphatase domain-containing protein n=1 Tax=Bionectria ochroleuca TaxID=29856 RepID=A0A8H7K3K3_BIOOC